MSDDKDVYSKIYSALRHPIRRRILIILSGGPRTFTEMLSVFGIESSHLTYHLKSLGELVSKTVDGSYALSTFGEMAVSVMGNVEHMREYEDSKNIPKYWLPFKRTPEFDSIAFDREDI